MGPFVIDANAKQSTTEPGAEAAIDANSPTKTYSRVDYASSLHEAQQRQEDATQSTSKLQQDAQGDTIREIQIQMTGRFSSPE